MKTYSAFNWMLYSRGLMVMPPEGVEGKEEEGIFFFISDLSLSLDVKQYEDGRVLLLLSG